MKRGFIDSPDGQIHYVTTGEGTPIVFLHPSPHSWNYFEWAIPYFSDRYKVYAMDTMGYGDSARPTQPYTSIAQFAQAVVHFLDGAGIEKATVIGHLTGSQIAAEVAAGWPDRVDRLVLSEVFNWDSPTRRAVHEKIHTEHPIKADGSHLIEMWNKYAEIAERTDFEHHERLFFNLYRVNRGPQPAEYGGMGWDGAAPWAMCRYPLWDRVPNITATTLGLYGVNSDIRRAGPKLQELIPNCRVESYDTPNMGGPFDSTEAWSTTVRAFLESTDK